jgi:hypothetical protein
MRVVLAAMALCLAACDDGDDDDAASTTSSTTAPPSTTTSTAPSSTTTTGPPRLTLEGISALRLGMSQAEAEQTRLLGPVGPGCELAGTTGANLLPPLVGSVEFSTEGRLEALNLRSGAQTAEGVAPNATLDEVRQAYDGRNGFTLTRDDTTEQVFGVFLMKAAKGEGSYTFVFDSNATRATSVAVPRASFCD